MLIIAALSASVLGFLYVKLAFIVIGLRRTNRISLGDGGRDDLNQAVRAHANLGEYAPIGLVLIAILELNHANTWLVALLALIFVSGRLLHPIGMINNKISWGPRVKGMQLTLTGILGLCIANLFLLAASFF